MYKDIEFDFVKRRSFTPMEEFLIDYWEKNADSRNFGLRFDMREYLHDNPLTQESYDKIEVFLKSHGISYDVICAKYGIGTEKMSYQEYAIENGISEQMAEYSYDAVPWFMPSSALQLQYLAVRPEHLRELIFDAQFELHSAMLAYDSITGKDTVHEHHVGAVDESFLGWKLFKIGYDTLEEVQDPDKDSSADKPSDIRRRGVLKCMAYEVSELLNKCGLENTLWRGALRIVSGSPHDKNYPLIHVREDYDEVKIIFRPKDFTVNKAEVMTTIDSLVFANRCTGADSDRLAHGDLRVFFNPVCHTAEDRCYVIEKLDAAIRKPNPEATL